MIDGKKMVVCVKEGGEEEPGSRGFMGEVPISRLASATVPCQNQKPFVSGA